LLYLDNYFYITMPIRNPFAKRPDVQVGLQPPSENNVRPLSQNSTRLTFERVDTVGSKSSSAMSIKSSRSQEPVEYKMSGIRLAPLDEREMLIDHLFKLVVNDSGVYLPVSSRHLAPFSQKVLTLGSPHPKRKAPYAYGLDDRIPPEIQPAPVIAY